MLCIKEQSVLFGVPSVQNLGTLCSFYKKGEEGSILFLINDTKNTSVPLNNQSKVFLIKHCRSRT